MFPLTHSINKQLLPVYDKPMFYYPLSLMMLCGIKEYVFVINQGQELNFRKALGNPDDLGIRVEFVVQKNPKGLPDAFIITKELIKNQSIAMILGDNFFYGNMLSPLIKESFIYFFDILNLSCNKYFLSNFLLKFIHKFKSTVL